MIAVLTLLTAVVFSLLVVRVATVALVLTGLSRDLARFEARSAFSGAGFTTRDSEKVVNHPVRRRIIMTLMLLGNAGYMAVISSLILSLIAGGGDDWWEKLPARVTFLLSGLVLLWFLAHSKLIDRQLSLCITWALKRFTRMEIHDYVGLLHLTSDYSVVEMHVDTESWLAGKTLAELRLNDEGILVLGIEQKSGNYAGAPKGQAVLHAGDTLLIYGPQEILEELVQRKADFAGFVAHRRAVEKQIHQAETAAD